MNAKIFLLSTAFSLVFFIYLKKVNKIESIVNLTMLTNLHSANAEEGNDFPCYQSYSLGGDFVIVSCSNCKQINNVAYCSGMSNCY